jgi:hypothetical protein
MDKEEIIECKRYEYEKTCEICGLIQTILTQEDSFPEYHTRIYLMCQCGNYIEFTLPVN